MSDLNGKVVVERFDFQMGREYLREICAIATQNFVDLGGVIHVCRPVFANGCEIGVTKRMAIRSA